ncbi:hypothetical protein ACJJTC_004465 [Scirpophaga incertulas]
MALFKNIKKAFMKEYLDLERNDIDLNMFHPQFRLLILPMGVFFNNTDSKIRFIWPTASLLLMFVWLGSLVYFIYYGVSIEDFFFATESFCYLVIYGVSPFIYGAMIIYRKFVWLITDEMDKDFIDMCKANNRHRKHFLDQQLLLWKLFFAWAIFTTFIMLLFIAMALIPLLFTTIFGTQDEHYERPFIFPVKVPQFDPLITPNYEIILCLEIYLCVVFLQCFPVYIYISFHILLHTCIKLDLVALDIKEMFTDLDSLTMTLPLDDERRIATQRTLRQRMKIIVDRHVSVFTSVTTLSKLVGPPLAYQLLVSSLCLCLIMYQIEVKLYGGVLDLRYVMLFCGHCLQLAILCSLGTILQTKAYAVGDACWNCGWQETPLGQLVRQDILIVILRSQQPLSIKFIGLPQLSLATFSSVISTAYTYFNMLRQYNNSHF